MEGTGATRIDTIFANEVGAHGCCGAHYGWEESMGLDHVAVSAEINASSFEDIIETIGYPVGIKIPPTPTAKEAKLKFNNDKNNLFIQIWDKYYDNQFNEAMDNNHTDEGHRIWCIASEHFLFALSKNDSTASLPEGIPRRGDIMPLHSHSVAKEFIIQQARASTTRNADVQSHIGRLRDLKNKIRSWSHPPKQKYTDEGDRNKITIDMDFECKDPIKGNKRDIGPAELKHALACIRKILDNDKLYRDNYLTTNCDNILEINHQGVDQIFKEMCTINQKEADQTNRDTNARTEKYLDIENDEHGARLYRAIKGDYLSKTITMVDPKTEQFTSNTVRIIECMEEAWIEPVFNRHKACPPVFKTFKDNYEQHFDKFTEAPTHLPDEDDLFGQAQRSKTGTVAGRDAFKSDELKALPKVAWVHRKRVFRCAIKNQQFPSNYKHVTTPCLPKKGPASKPLQHRLLSIFSAIYRIEAGAWFRILYPWFIGNLHPDIHSGVPGHETAEVSWDAQADLEQAIINRMEFIILMVDYYKFFDSFDHQWVREFLHMLHFPHALVEMIFDLYIRLQRGIKIGKA